MAGKGVIMKPRQLDLDGSAGGVRRSDVTDVGCLPSVVLIVVMSNVSASTRITRTNSVLQASTEGLNA